MVSREELFRNGARAHTHASDLLRSLSLYLSLKFDVYLDMFKCYSVYIASTVDLVKTKPMLSPFLHALLKANGFFCSPLLLFLLLLLLLDLVYCALPFFVVRMFCIALN